MAQEKMIIGNEYEVVFAENHDGTFEKESQTLIGIENYNGKEIYIFEGCGGYPMATYNYVEKIDWDFMEEINDKFGY